MPHVQAQSSTNQLIIILEVVIPSAVAILIVLQVRARDLQSGGDQFSDGR
jgi:hypothetical protein